MTRTMAAFAVLALFLSACGTGEPLGPPIGLAGSWQLTSGTSAGSDLEPISSHPVTITFDGDEVTGTAACNGYGGTFTLNESAIDFSDLIITEMGCFPTEVMELEQAFMTALGVVKEATVENDVLVLSGPDTRLEFEALPSVSAAGLLGTVWILDGLVSGESVSSVMGDQATLELFSDGSLIGSTGCRQFNGTYVEEAALLTTTAITARGDCPDDVSAQDEHVMTVLEDSFQTEIDTRTLYLTTSGELGLVYRADG